MINIVEVNYNTDIKTCIGILNKTSNTCFVLFVLNMKNEALSLHSILKQFETANLNLNVINLEQFIAAFNSSFLHENDKDTYISFIKQLYFRKIKNYV